MPKILEMMTIDKKATLKVACFEDIFRRFVY